MSVAAFLVVCLAAGFYAGTKWKVSKVYISKDPGHPLYFLSALIAFYLAICALAFDSAAFGSSNYSHFLDLAESLLRPVVEADDLGRLARSLILTTWVIGLALVLPRLLNWPLNSNSALLDQLAEKYGEREAIDDVIRDALRLQLPVAVTLDDSKVYIGFPISGEPFGMASKRWLRVRPLLSGYRDSQRQLQLTTDYQAVISALEVSDDAGAASGRAFDIVVPFDRITSLHPFDLESYSNYFVGNEWDEADQALRVQQLSVIADESEPNSLHRRDYWAFAAFLALTPCVGLFSPSWSILPLALAAALGFQAARPIQE